MERIGLQTNIVEAINAINDKSVDPILDFGDYLYYFDTRDVERGVIIYTRFDKNNAFAPVDTSHTRYGTYHTIHQVIYNPLPRGVYEAELDSLPESVLKQSMVDPTIILGFY